MGIEQLGKVTSVAQSHLVREEGARVAREITETVLGSVRSGKLTMAEVWVILVGTMRQIGMIGGMAPGSQLENVRQLYETAAKGEVNAHIFGTPQ